MADNEQNVKKEPATNATDSSKPKRNYRAKKAESQPEPGVKMPDPWPEPVDGLKLVQELQDVYKRYMVLPEGALQVLPLWVLHTYALKSFNYTPRLCICSPVPRCGKSQLLQLLEMTSYCPLNISGITAAGIFRVIDVMHPTLLIDEADCYMQGDNTMRSVINAGYKFGGKVMRNVETPGGYMPKQFDCYAAMAIAGIGSRDTTVMDRSIVIMMVRRKPTDKVEKLRPNLLVSETEELRSMCLRFMADNASAISRTVPHMPQFLNDRASDIWEPLFTIAEFISPDLVQDLTCAAKRMVPITDDDEVLEIQLLADIHEILDEMEADFIPTRTLLTRLYNYDNRPWHDKQYGQLMLTDSRLARMLQGFQIRPIQKRIGQRRERGYEREAFDEAFSSYLPPQTCDPVTDQDTTEPECHDVTVATEVTETNDTESPDTEPTSNVPEANSPEPSPDTTDSVLSGSAITCDAEARFEEAERFSHSNPEPEGPDLADIDFDIPY